MFIDYEERREADRRMLEEIRAVPMEQQLKVEAELQYLADHGYREDEVLWAYERLLAKRGQAFP